MSASQENENISSEKTEELPEKARDINDDAIIAKAKPGTEAETEVPSPETKPKKKRTTKKKAAENTEKSKNEKSDVKYSIPKATESTDVINEDIIPPSDTVISDVNDVSVEEAVITESEEAEATPKLEAEDVKNSPNAATEAAEAAKSDPREEPFSPTVTETENISFFGEAEIAYREELLPEAPAEPIFPDVSFIERGASQLSFFEEEENDTQEGSVLASHSTLVREIPLFIPNPPKPSEVKRKSVYNSEKPRSSDTVFDFIELFIISLIAVLIFTSFFFRHSKVDGDSMMNTLQDGEHLIVSDTFYTPKRGDIVVIEDYSTGLKFALVKRVIAIGGDHIEVSSSGRVTLNGKLLDEPYVYTDGQVYERAIDLVVPEGEIFVMGDHRNNSTDSRRFGTVKVDSIIGKVLIRVYPFEVFGKVE